MEHEKASKGKSILIFHRAIRKYGIENFNWEILYKCYDNLELNLKEIEFIKKLNPMPPNGYNLSTGGTGGNNISFNPNKENICQGISRKLKGIKRGQPTEEHKQKNRESNLGRKDSKKTIKKRSKAVAKSWTLISSENEIVTEFDISLKQYCEQNELSYNLLRKYRNNFVPFNKNTVKVKTIGWKLIENIKYQLNDNVKIKGVRQLRKNGSWGYNIQYNNKRYIKYGYLTIEDAMQAREEVGKRLHSEFNI